MHGGCTQPRQLLQKPFPQIKKNYYYHHNKPSAVEMRIMKVLRMFQVEKGRR